MVKTKRTTNANHIRHLNKFINCEFTQNKGQKHSDTKPQTARQKNVPAVDCHECWGDFSQLFSGFKLAILLQLTVCHVIIIKHFLLRRNPS